MAEFVYVNGEFVPKAEAKVSFFDHGYLYGDAVFEGIRVYNGRVFRLEAHVERLLFSTHALGFPKGDLTMESVSRAILETCRKSDHYNGYIRVNVSRGTGLGLDPSHIELKPSLTIATNQLRLYHADLYETGLTMVTCAMRVIPPDVIDPRIKCNGKYINNILAKMEANRVGAGEGLMLNHQGYVAEATGDNIFVIRKGAIYTPPPSTGCLKGVTRQVAWELAENMGLTVREENLTLYDVYNAEECFLTGTGAEVIPAISLDDRPIGNGKPGDITRRLIAAFRAYTAETGTPL
jgi:branched-chain amino acid aminotransferase